MKLCRVNNGVILVNPSLSLTDNGVCTIETDIAVSNLMQMPVSFWMLDTNSETQLINSEGIKVCGYRSEDDALGNSIMPVSEPRSALQLIRNCEEVMTSNEIKIFEEQHIRNDGLEQQFLSVKLPMYDFEKNLIGVCGFSIVLGRHSLSDNLSMLIRLGIIGNVTSAFNHSPSLSNYLPPSLPSMPPREKQCLNYLMQGYTAKMIARELCLSKRTIENYIHNLKTRLGVFSKNELIQFIRRQTK